MKVLSLGFFFLIIPVCVFSQIITFETANTSLIYLVNKDKRLTFQYYGSKLKAPKIYESQLYQENQVLQSRNQNNDAYPSFGRYYINEPAISAVHSDGGLVTELQYVRTEDVPCPEGFIHKVIYLKDSRLNFEVELHTEAYKKEDVINQWTVIVNKENSDVRLSDFYSGHLYLNSNSYYLSHFNGTWASEMNFEEELLTHGIKTIESKKGVRTSLTENSAFILSLNQEAKEDEGDVIGGALAWSGNYKMCFQVDEWGQLNVLGGINPFQSEITLSKGERFETPKFVFTFSSKGKGQVSRNLHDWARQYALVDGFSPRPVVLNSWEGANFNINEKVLTGMMNEASMMGIEMFVVDDGWFGNKYPRLNDKAGLGDWQSNKDKLPHGIGYLSNYAKEKGLKFGIWIEPEMVNPKSVLAETHPEWVVQTPGREELLERTQLILDLTNPAVQNFVWTTVDKLLTDNPGIAYLKWDANRNVNQPGSTYLPKNRQTAFWIEYIKGLYKVYDKIRAKYPALMIQACSSGGGRVDFGSLRYHNEFWASDDTDPLQRLYIQYGTNLIYPPIATASHVSAVPNEQTGGISPLKFRFDVAMTGRLGMELQPKEIQGKDRKFAIQAIENYKLIRPLIAGGDLYRIISPYDKGGWVALMYVSKDKKEAAAFAFSTQFHQRGIYPTIKLKGLDESLKYKVTEINKTKNSFWGNDELIEADFLLNSGMDISISKLYDSAVFMLKAQ